MMITIVLDDLVFPEEIVGSHLVFINSFHCESWIRKSQGCEPIDYVEAQEGADDSVVEGGEDAGDH